MLKRGLQEMAQEIYDASWAELRKDRVTAHLCEIYIVLANIEVTLKELS